MGSHKFSWNPKKNVTYGFPWELKSQGLNVIVKKFPSNYICCCQIVSLPNYEYFDTIYFKHPFLDQAAVLVTVAKACFYRQFHHRIKT